MTVLRPLPKRLLKRMFLKVLSEATANMNKYVDYRALLRFGFPNYLGIKPLNDDEYHLGLEAVVELERDNYIERVLGGQGIRYKLTKKAIAQTKKPIEEMRISSVGISDLEVNPLLLHRVSNAYRSGDYEDVVFKATKYLEEKVRAKAGLAPSDIGTKLMDKAFGPNNRKLNCTLCVDESERSGLHFLYRGTVGFFKNPSSHRTVKYDDPNKVLQILGYINVLLDILNQCQLISE